MHQHIPTPLTNSKSFQVQPPAAVQDVLLPDPGVARGAPAAALQEATLPLPNPLRGEPRLPGEVQQRRRRNTVAPDDPVGGRRARRPNPKVLDPLPAQDRLLDEAVRLPQLEHPREERGRK